MEAQRLIYTEKPGVGCVWTPFGVTHGDFFLLLHMRGPWLQRIAKQGIFREAGMGEEKNWCFSPYLNSAWVMRGTGAFVLDYRPKCVLEPLVGRFVSEEGRHNRKFPA